MKRNGEKHQGLTENVKRNDGEKWRKKQGLTKNVKRNDEEKWRTRRRLARERKRRFSSCSEYGSRKKSR